MNSPQNCEPPMGSQEQQDERDSRVRACGWPRSQCHSPRQGHPLGCSELICCHPCNVTMDGSVCKARISHEPDGCRCNEGGPIACLGTQSARLKPQMRSVGSPEGPARLLGLATHCSRTGCANSRADLPITGRLRHLYTWAGETCGIGQAGVPPSMRLPRDTVSLSRSTGRGHSPRAPDHRLRRGSLPEAAGLHRISGGECVL